MLAYDDSSSSDEDEFYSHKSRRSIVVDVSQCKYEVVKRVINDLGWRCSYNESSDDYHILWTDLSVSAERVMRLHHSRKRLNHFPSMDLIGRKIPLAINVARMQKQYPNDFDFLPKSYVDFKEFLADRAKEVSEGNNNKKRKRKEQPPKYFIVKPNSGCMGKGIFMTSKPTSKMFDNAVVQEYIGRPLLIEGLKFDLRCYVLLGSATPLRIFVFKDGLVRMCAESYEPPTEENIKQTCSHITNYAVNKRSKAFVFNKNATNGDEGNKRDFQFFNRWLRNHGYCCDTVWGDIHDLIIKTFLSVNKILSQSYKSCVIHEWHNQSTCFELLGFDVLLDETLKPWLLEVNHSPNLNIDSPLDYQIKSAVVREVLQLVNLGPFMKQQYASSSSNINDKRTKFEDSVLDQFERIYPPPPHEENKYLQFMTPYGTSSMQSTVDFSGTQSSRRGGGSQHSAKTGHRSRSSDARREKHDPSCRRTRSGRRKLSRTSSNPPPLTRAPLIPTLTTEPPHQQQQQQVGDNSSESSTTRTTRKLSTSNDTLNAVCTSNIQTTSSSSSASSSSSTPPRHITSCTQPPLSVSALNVQLVKPSTSESNSSTSSSSGCGSQRLSSRSFSGDLSPTACNTIAQLFQEELGTTPRRTAMNILSNLTTDSSKSSESPRKCTTTPPRNGTLVSACTQDLVDAPTTTLGRSGDGSEGIGAAHTARRPTGIPTSGSNTSRCSTLQTHESTVVKASTAALESRGSSRTTCSSGSSSSTYRHTTSSTSHTHGRRLSASFFNNLSNCQQQTINPYLASVIRTQPANTKVLPPPRAKSSSVLTALQSKDPSQADPLLGVGRRKFVEKFKKIVESAEVTSEVKTSLVRFLMMEHQKP